jgi:hypothetical protein
MSWKGRTFDSRRDLTISEFQRRVGWDTVGLPGTRLGSCNHQSLFQRDRYLSISSCRVESRRSECHSIQIRVSPRSLKSLIVGNAVTSSSRRDRFPEVGIDSGDVGQMPRVLGGNRSDVSDTDRQEDLCRENAIPVNRFGYRGGTSSHADEHL